MKTARNLFQCTYKYAQKPYYNQLTKQINSRFSSMQSQVKPPSKPKYHDSKKMMAAQYVGKKKVKVDETPMPIVTDPTDAIIKITAATICGSDLHFYERAVPGMTPGYIMGHEGVGIVEEVGPHVKNFKKGDRVVVSAVLGCGECAYCKRGEWSCCDTTNPNVLQEKLHGHHIGGFIGYSHAFGGYDGCNAEYVRVVFADVNLFHIPEGVTDKQAICMPDVGPTAWHGTFLTDIKEGDTVAVFGCGPVGLLTQMWAKYRGASVVVAIDVDQQRLDFAKEKFGSEIINSKDEDPIKAVHKIIPGGPDVAIDCVGFRFPDTWLHKIEFKLKLETDAPNIVNAAMEMVRKNGRVGVIGDYAAFTNHFNIGALMEKHLTVSGGCVWPQTHQKHIFEAMQSGKVDPTVIFTHTFPLSKADEAYAKFDAHEDGTIKVLILPDEIYKKSGEANKQS